MSIDSKDFAGAKGTAALIADAEKRAALYKTIAEAQRKAGDIAGAKKTEALQAGAENDVKTEKLAHDELWNWASKFGHDDERKKAMLPDWQVFSASLKGKKPDEAVADVVKLTSDLAEAFFSIRVAEAKWKKLRPQAWR